MKQQSQIERASPSSQPSQHLRRTPNNTTSSPFPFLPSNSRLTVFDDSFPCFSKVKLCFKVAKNAVDVISLFSEMVSRNRNFWGDAATFAKAQTMMWQRKMVMRL